MAKIRVLNITEVFQAAGIESFIMNMYRNIDRSDVQFDFMVMRDVEEFYDAEIAGLGGQKFTITVPAGNTLVQVLQQSVKLYRFLKKNPYRIVHVHYTTPLRAFYLLAAKLAGVPVRIYHSHSAEVSGKSAVKRFVYAYCRKKITKWATHYFACSRAAGNWIFEEKLIRSGQVRVICNGIDVDRFRYCPEARESVRKELGMEDAYVLIHTGRFLEQKNHAFIIDVFRALLQKHTGCKLLLVGTGELLAQMQQKVRSYGIEKNVFFLGVRSDVERLLSAADCYIMPSLYEGLPVAAVEAQCSGLPCVLSDNITDEVALTDSVSFLSLQDPVDTWCDKILSYSAFVRKDRTEDITKMGYNVYNGAKALEAFYKSCCAQ